MDKNLGLKALLLSIISTVLTSNVLAQQGFGAWGLGDQGLEVFISFANAATWYEINTFPQLAFFIAIWFAMYFLSLKFIDLIWTVMTNRIKKGGGGKYGIKTDDTDKTEKGLAVAVAFIATQYIGMVIGPILGSAMLLFGAMFAITVAIIFYYFIVGAGGRFGTPGSGGSGSSGGSASFTATVSDEIKDLIGEGKDKATDAEKKAEEAGKEEKDAEKKAKEGKTDEAEAEAEDAANRIETALQELEIATQDVQAVLNTDHEQVAQTLNELSETLSLDEEEEELIGRMQNDLGQAQSIISELADSVEWFKTNGDLDEEFFLKGNADSPGLLVAENILDELANLESTLAKEATEEEKEVEKEIQEVLTEITELARAHSVIQIIKHAEKLAHEEEAEMEKIASVLHSQHLAKEDETMEGQQEQLENQLKTLLSEEEELKETLGRAEQILAQLEEMDHEELEQLTQEGNEIQSLEEQANRMRGELYDYYGSSKNFSSNAPNIAQASTDVLNHLGALEEGIQNIVEIKRKEESELDNAISQVDRALSEIEG